MYCINSLILNIIAKWFIYFWTKIIFWIHTWLGSTLWFWSTETFPRFLDHALTSTFGMCKLATSQYLLVLAEATTMYVTGALLLEDSYLDGWTFGTGDSAEKLTLGVATKRVDCFTWIGATQNGHHSKAVFEGQVDHFLTKLTSEGARPGTLSSEVIRTNSSCYILIFVLHTSKNIITLMTCWFYQINRTCFPAGLTIDGFTLSLNPPHCQIGLGCYLFHPIMLLLGFQLCHLQDSNYT